jgi:hypothetical protein
MTEALANVKPSPIVDTAPDAPAAAALDHSFKKKADKLHAKILAKIESIDKGIVELGEMGLDMKDQAYFTVIRRSVDEDGNAYENPALAPCYKTSSEYFRAVLPQGNGKTQMFQAMRVVRELTSGDNPIMTRAEVNGMTKENAEGMAKLKQSGVAITPEIKQQAKDLPIRRFAKEVVQALVPGAAVAAAAGEGRSLAHEPAILMKISFEWPSILMAEWNAVMEMARHAAADSDRTEPLQEKALWLLLVAGRNEFQAGWEQHLFEEEQEAALKASEAQAVPDGPDEEDDEVMEALDQELLEAEEDELRDPSILAAIQNAPDAEEAEFVETRTVEPDEE